MKKRKKPARRASKKRETGPRAPARSRGPARARQRSAPDARARAGERPRLARDLLTLYGTLASLERVAADEDERRRLREQRDAAGARFDEVMARVVREDSEEYRAATASVKDAIGRIEDAIDGLASVAAAIEGAARAVDAVGRVIAVFAGGG